MSETSFGSLSAQQRDAIVALALKERQDKSFFFSNNMIGKNLQDMSKPFHYVPELTKQATGAKTATYMLANMLTGKGVVNGQVMEGKEEKVEAGTQTIQLGRIRNGVRNAGRLDEYENVLKLRDLAPDLLGEWAAAAMDTLAFLTLFGIPLTTELDGLASEDTVWGNLAFASDISAPSTNRLIYQNSRASTDTITASDKMNWAFLVKMKTMAKRKRLPAMIDGGKEKYMVLMTPEQERDLNLDPVYQSILSAAEKRGSTNPLFTGAFAEVNGLYLFSHERCPNTLGLASGSKWGSGGTIDGANCALLGRQAVGVADVREHHTYDEKPFDYGEVMGASIGFTIGLKKSKFLSKHEKTPSIEDYGVIVGRTAAAES